MNVTKEEFEARLMAELKHRKDEIEKKKRLDREMRAYEYDAMERRKFKRKRRKR